MNQNDLLNEIQSLFEKHLYGVSVEISPSKEKTQQIDAFLNAQEFINYFTYFWNLFEEWIQKDDQRTLLLLYFAEDGEEVEYELTGWQIHEVYQYLKDVPPAGTIVPTDANEEIPERSDSPPEIHLIFSA